jgi:hypothetical protein
MTQWGRSPSAGYWMSQGPRTTAMVVLLAIGLGGGVGKREADRLSPLQRHWLPTMMKSSIASALDLDPLEYTFNGTTGHRNNVAARDFIIATVYDGRSLWQRFRLPLAAAGVVIGLFLIPAIASDLRRNRQRRQGRWLRGTRLLTARAFNRHVRPRRLRLWFRQEEAGIHIRQHRAPTIVLPRKIEDSHAQIIADTGGGKTTLIHAYCEHAERRGESMVILDVDGAYLKTWWKPERGDVILNPGDPRTWAWDSADEVRDPLEAMSLATSLIPRDPVETNKFFTNSARTIVAHLLSLRLSPPQMVTYLTDERRLLALLKGTHIQDVLPGSSAQQRAGVMSPLNMLAVSLALCPTPHDCGGRTWSAASWAQQRKGWIFITGTPTTREQLRPLQTLWFDALILRMMTVPGPPTKVVFDELATLQKLWQLHAGLAEGRKHHIGFVLGFQGRAQIDELYGKAAETMLSQAAAQYTLRVSDWRAAETASKNIGQAEMERIEESRQEGWRRSGASFSLRRAPDFVFMPSQIQGLADLHGYLKVRDAVTTLRIPVIPRPARTAAFVPRPPRPRPPLPHYLPGEDILPPVDHDQPVGAVLPL